MASRPELVQMAIELDLEWTSMSVAALIKEIKLEVDRRFNKKTIHISADNLSDTLKKYITKEMDYVILDENGEKQ